MALTNVLVSIPPHRFPRSTGHGSNYRCWRTRSYFSARIFHGFCIRRHPGWGQKVGEQHPFVHCQLVSMKDHETRMMHRVPSKYPRSRRVAVTALRIYPSHQDGHLTGAEFHDTLPPRKVKKQAGRAQAPSSHCLHEPLSAPS